MIKITSIKKLSPGPKALGVERFEYLITYNNRKMYPMIMSEEAAYLLSNFAGVKVT